MFTDKQNLMAILQKSAKIYPHTQYAQIKETTEFFLIQSDSATIQLQIILRNKRISSHLPTVVNSSFH